MTDKPTIFFSHSTHDAKALRLLKEKFCAATANVIDVFLSSDGSSIPFGHNWQKTIENALSRCRLMFTFLTPQSVDSRWIYFESGFANARGIRVVPVGLEGIDLAQQPPPLQLLNGFNIRGHEGLNNLISVTNDVFSQAHVLSFQPSDYDELLQKGGLGATRALGRHGDNADFLVVEVTTTNLDPSFWTRALSALPGAEVLANEGHNEPDFLGVRISAFNTHIGFVIDRLAIDVAYPLVESILSQQRDLIQGIEVNLYLKSNILLQGNELRNSAALIGTGWKKKGTAFVLPDSASGELRFQTKWYEEPYDQDECAYLVVSGVARAPTLANLRAIMDLCFDAALLRE